MLTLLNRLGHELESFGDSASLLREIATFIVDRRS